MALTIDDLPNQLAALMASIKQPAKAYLVGGCVRDALLGHPVHDYDIEVYGMPMEKLPKHLQSRGRTDAVEVLWRHQMVAQTRRDLRYHSLERNQHRYRSPGFSVHADPFLPLEAACERRDFTINPCFIALWKND